MNLGEKITELRKHNNLTQEQLGKELNISAQAVSKWERNLSEPDLYAIKAMSNIFNISIDALINNDKELEFKNIIIENKSGENYECSNCHKKYDKSDIYQIEPNIICKECNSKVEKQINTIVTDDVNVDTDNSKVEDKNIKKKKWFQSSLLIKFIISIGISLILMILGFVFGNINNVGDVVATIVGAIVIFTFLFQTFSETIIQDIVFGSFGKSIQMPGIIFSLDIDSIIFMLAYKFIIAPLIVFIVGVVVFLGGLLLAFIISPFTFFFTLPGVIEDCKDDDKDKLKNNIKNIEKE
ncbi:MAG TPA: hypothetical protein DD621_05645 [Clostridiales bacterium]|nr:hypothetical protein [Clostridiales bacterium]